jgi:hypothetical protein
LPADRNGPPAGEKTWQYTSVTEPLRRWFCCYWPAAQPVRRTVIPSTGTTSTRKLPNTTPISSAWTPSNPPGNESRIARYVKDVLEREGVTAQLFALDAARANVKLDRDVIFLAEAG